MEARIIGRVFLCSLSRKVASKTAKTVGGTVIRTKKTTTAASDHGIHRSDAQAQVNKIPVIEVNGNHAVCDGGGGALGHPVEWIQLDTVSKLPQVCKYCGLRFIKAKGGAHHH